jgi:hypothetical protein
LGSLCIAIAAFTSQTYPDTQTYAITAASLFLMAFVLSLIFKIVKGSHIAFLSYISTALAVVFLFIVIATFAQSIPMLSKSLSSLSSFLSIFMFYLVVYFFYKYQKKRDSEAIKITFLVGLPLGVFVIFYWSLLIIANFMNFTIPFFIAFLAIYFSFVFAAFFAIAIVIDIRNQRAKKNPLPLRHFSISKSPEFLLIMRYKMQIIFYFWLKTCLTWLGCSSRGQRREIALHAHAYQATA